MSKGTLALQGHGAAYIVVTAPAQLRRVPHTLAIAVSPTAMDPTFRG